MRRTLLSLALGTLLATTGCLGRVDAAQLHEQALRSNDWELAGEDRSSVAMGLGQLVTRDYAPDGGSGFDAGVTVATGNDVPLFNEARFIGGAIERIEERHGVTFEETGTQTLELEHLDRTVEATTYDIQDAPADGAAIVYDTDCGDFVAVAAWGSTESGGLFGGGEPPYQEAVDMAKALTC